MYHLDRQIHRGELPAEIPEHSDGEEGPPGVTVRLGFVAGDLHRASFWLEGTGARRRDHLSDHRGARLRVVLRPGLLLPPPDHYLGDVLPGVRGGQKGKQRSEFRAEDGEISFRTSDPTDPSQKRSWSERVGIQPQEQTSFLSASPQVLQGKESGQDPGDSCGMLRSVLASIFCSNASW